jgi:GTPase Era involved in 16S rRNA processing
MQEVSNYTQELTNRISAIVDSLFKGSSFYTVRLNKQERIEHLVELFRKFSPEDFRAIPEHELTDRIAKLLTLEAVSGTLNDLTPEQMKIYDESVEGK